MALLCERLGQWHRWWVVFPLTAALAWNVPLWSWYRLDWQTLAFPFVALAGVLSAGYLRRPAMAFSPTEQRLAAGIWVVSATFGVVTHWNHASAPALAWAIGFAGMWLALLRTKPAPPTVHSADCSPGEC